MFISISKSLFFCKFIEKLSKDIFTIIYNTRHHNNALGELSAMFEISLEEVRRDKKNVPSLLPYKYIETLNEDSIYKYDFKLMHILTKCERNADNSTTYFTLEDLIKFNNDDYFINSFDKISQIYYIRPVLFDKDHIKTFAWTLQLNKNLTLLKATLTFNMREPYSKELLDEVMEDFYKILIKNKILIGIRKNSLFEDKLNEFLKNLESENSNLEAKFVIAKGVELVDSIPDRIEFCMEAGKSAEDYCTLANKDDLLCVYYPAIIGKNGRDLQGKIISTQELNPYENAISHNENVVIKKEENKVSFYAKEYGYFIVVDKECKIVNTILKSTIDVKNVGSLKTDTHEKVSLQVMNVDELEDGIKAGITLEVKDIDIAGNVDAATLIGEEITVDGQTHKKSSITAHKAYVKLHKGLLRAQKVCVDTLEGGEIIADTVFVNKSIGGTIIANNIYVRELHSGTTIYANENIIVDKISGNSNQFIFDKDIFLREILDFSEEKKEDILENLEEELYAISKGLVHFYNLIVKNQNQALRIREEIEEKKSKTGYVEFMTQYEQYKRNYQNSLRKYTDLSKLKYLLDFKVYSMRDKILSGKLIIRYGNIGEENLILYKIDKPIKREFREVLAKQTTPKAFKTYLEIKSFKGEIFEEYHLPTINSDEEEDKEESKPVIIDMIIKNELDSNDYAWIDIENENLKDFLQKHNRNNNTKDSEIEIWK